MLVTLIGTCHILGAKGPLVNTAEASDQFTGTCDLSSGSGLRPWGWKCGRPCYLLLVVQDSSALLCSVFVLLYSDSTQQTGGKQFCKHPGTHPISSDKTLCTDLCLTDAEKARDSLQLPAGDHDLCAKQPGQDQNCCMQSGR